MKVSNSNHNDVLDLGNVTKNRKSNRADANKASESSAATQAGGIGETASVELSSDAKALARANQMAKSEDIDQAKIDRIKAMIAERKYNPDYGKVADKVVNETLLQDLA